MPSCERADEDEDRRIAALILRRSLQQAEHAKEEGSSAYLLDGETQTGPGRVNERLLKGEVNQMRSFNKRAGVDTAKLPALPAQAHMSPLQRETTALDRMYVQRAHELREYVTKASATGQVAGGSHNVDVVESSGDRERRDVFSNFGDRRGKDQSFGWGEKLGPCFDFAKGNCSRDNCRFSHDPRDRIESLNAGGKGNREPPEPQKKRQRVGANGVALDIVAAEEAASRQAEEDLELANPLMRGPAVSKSSMPAIGVDAKSSEKVGCTEADVKTTAESWASKKLRVRVVDENGEFRRNHLKKGVIRHVDSRLCCVDVELDGSEGKVLRAVPQRLLETVVSKSCTKVEIVRGPRRGMLGELLCRDPKRNVAVVRLGRANEGQQIELLLDDVCEYL